MNESKDMYDVIGKIYKKYEGKRTAVSDTAKEVLKKHADVLPPSFGGNLIFVKQAVKKHLKKK